MFKKANIILMCALFVQYSFAQKQNLQFSHLTSQDGLGSNSVFSIVQDSKGFLWAGTWDGLCRYDGFNFKIFRTIENDSKSISDNKIRALCEGENGDLWIGTWYNGLNYYDPKTEKFTRYLHNPNDSSSISNDNILSICFDKTGFLWIGTDDGGLNKLDLGSKKFSCYKNNPDDSASFSNYSIFSICEGKYGLLWIGTAPGGLKLFDKEKSTFTSFKFDPYSTNSISSNSVASVLEDRSGILWVGTFSAGLNKFDKKSDQFIRYSASMQNSPCSDMIWALFEDSQGIFWIGTNNGGLSIFDQNSGLFTCYLQNSNDPASLNDNTVVSISEDRSGILWFGTWNGGINKYNKYDKKFVTYTHDSNDPFSLSTNSIFPIYVDSFGDLWVGTDIAGLNRKIKGSGKFEHFTHQQGSSFGISDNTINSICEDNDGNIWIATDGGGICKYDRARKKFTNIKHIPNDPSSLTSDRITQIFFDSKGDLWIGNEIEGVDKLAKGKLGVIHYQPDPDNPKSISSKAVFAINEDTEGNLWFGTNGAGLNKYIRETGEFVHFKYDPNDPQSISNNEIFVIHIGSDSTIWVGTGGGGLNKFNKENGSFKRFNVENGFPSNMISGILEDDHGNLWISTYKGLSKFDPKTESIRNFSIADGLTGDEFNNWSYFKDDMGRMYFGSTNGMNVFHPDSLNDNPYPPPIVITDFQILHKPVAIGFDSTWNRTILKKSISETNLLELNYDDNIISFEFAALDFRNPARNQYAYFLEGFDKNWIYANAQKRYVTYTNLDPGEYIFKVKGSNNDGVWNEEGTSLDIVINPPWWATWWSYMLYGFVTVLIFTGSTRFYLNREKLKTQLQLEHEHAIKLEEVDKIKSNFYANISHEFRTPLMLILGPIEKLKTKLMDDESIKQAGVIRGNAKRLLNLINQLLDLSRLEAKKLKLNASKNNISQFIKGLVREFESVADQRDISLKLIVEKENIEVYFDKEKLERVITNVMSNAIKFTPGGGRITVKVAETSEGEVEITIRDSGIGIPRSELMKIFDRFYQVDSSHTREHEGTGIGLALTKEYVELHKGQISIDSVEGHWTEVKIYFPLGKSHLSEDEIKESAEFKARDIESVAEYGLGYLNVDDIESEDLIDKTIVLVVEDNVDLRDYIKDDLKSSYHVEEAANGEQGLRKAKKCIPDLIVSDVMMPLMDGYEMTKKLRQDEKTSHIPIILLTAKSDKDSKLEGLGLGVDDYLTKPFDTEELLARIKNLIENRRMLQEKFGSGNVVLQKPEKEKLNYLDQQFLDRVMTVINEHISEEEFSIEEFGKDVGMSRSQMHRKLKALTGKSTSLYLRTVRLAKARELIEQRKASISEISYQVGFSSPAYFSRCFKEEFGYPPSEVN